jgi:hypothetical protein
VVSLLFMPPALRMCPNCNAMSVLSPLQDMEEASTVYLIHCHLVIHLRT